MLTAKVLRDHVAAISCGIHDGQPVLDLDYVEDFAAGTDANFVMTGKGGIVEIQGTAEKALQRRRIPRSAGARPQRLGGWSTCSRWRWHDRVSKRRARSAARTVIATHNAGKLPNCANCSRSRFEAVSAGELELPEPDETARHCQNAAGQGESRGQCLRHWRVGR